MRTCVGIGAIFLASCGGSDSPKDPCNGVDCGAGTCLSTGASARCDCEDGFVAQGLRCVEDGGSDSDVDSDADSDSDTGTECVDGDTDGACLPEDCDDGNPDVHPGAEDNPTGWTIEEIDAQGDTRAEIATDGSNLYVAYVARNGASVRYATNASGAWVRDTIEESGRTIHWASIAIDSRSFAHVAYGAQDAADVADADYATNESGAFQVLDTFRTAVPPHPEIAVDGADTVFMSFENCEPSYVADPGGSASLFVLHAGMGCVGPYTDIAASDQVYVAYTRDPFVYVDRSGDGFSANVWGGGTDLPGQFAWEPDDELALAWPRRGDAGTEIAAYLPHVAFGNEFAMPGATVSIAIDDAPYLAVADGDANLWTQTAQGPWRSEEFDHSIEPSVSIAVTPDALHVVYSMDGLQVAHRARGDGVDQNCDGHDGVDADGDGYASWETWGGDCEDSDPDRHPDAAELPGPPDANCNGYDEF